MINLFEYQNKAKITPELEGLESFLGEIWRNRGQSSYFQDKDKVESQQFLQFLYNTGELKSNKYVGVIHFNGEKINLLPKVFYESGGPFDTSKTYKVHKHILWWLRYCRKIRFPKYQTSLGSAKSDFFEVLIYLFSKYTRELLNKSIYQQFEDVNSETSFLKGKLNIDQYINQNLGKGRWHKFNCSYDSLLLDNKFNRIVKYVANLLKNVTSDKENKKYLRDILFILDDVTDEKCTAEDCGRISFNPYFEDFQTVKDYCRLFLSNCISFDYKNDLKLFAFLLPMDYVFEDFITGFIEQEMPAVNVKYQRSDTYLDESKVFNLKPDLFLQASGKSMIADAKYKFIYSNKNDPKCGISQSDLYQMLAYAVRFKVNEIILFYPNTLKSNQGTSAEFAIKDQLANDQKITIKAFQVPIINKNLFEQSSFPNAEKLNKLFEPTKNELKAKLEEILKLAG